MQWSCLVALSLVSFANAHGSGVWKDLNHLQGDGSLAGIRFVAETTHALTLVSTDDGVDWYTLHGKCSGPGMTTITFDFAPKGGPSEPLSGTWAHTDEGGATITWPDGNVWAMAEGPTAAWLHPTPLDDHQGLFTDASFRSRAAAPAGEGFGGTRVISEFPPHKLTVVGSDDGASWWVARGNCSGPHMTHIAMDFGPRGGAQRGTWTSAASLQKRQAASSSSTAASSAAALPAIAWDDGVTWSKNRPEGTTDPSPGTPPPVSPGVSSGEDLTQMTIPLMAAAAVLALLGVVLGIAYAAGRRTAAAKRAGLL